MNLTEALKLLKNNNYLIERYYDEPETETIKAPIIISNFINCNGEPSKMPDEIVCKLGLSNIEKEKIENILPNFIKIFDSSYDTNEGDENFINIDVIYRSESAKWDGKDFGTYDPGYGETEIIDNTFKEDIDEAIKITLNDWCSESTLIDYLKIFNLSNMEILKDKLAKIYNIIVNRSKKDNIG